jgi:mycothiol maleylpyruvate isomerase-like protein
VTPAATPPERRASLETSPGPWIDAVRHSHDRLRAVAGPLGPGQLQQPSYAAKWSIAQVLSHLGSQAEAFGLLLDAGLSGQDPPGQEAFISIWQAWDAKNAQAQAADALRADQTITERFESLDAGHRERLRLKMFGTDLDTAGLARMRLGEHAICRARQVQARPSLARPLTAAVRPRSAWRMVTG